MHHAPAGPSLPARLTAFARRTRLLPMTAAGLVVAGIALAGPPSAAPGEAGTAALTMPSEGGRALVPATGEGWTQDGATPPPVALSPAPADSPPTDTGAPAPATSSAPAAPAAGTTAASSAAASATSAASSAASSAAASAPSGTATRSTSSAPSTSPSSSSPAPAPAPVAPVAPVAVPGVADQVLAAVDDARTAAGCAPLVRDAALAGAATGHSTAMRDAAGLLPPAGTGLVAGPLTDPAAVAVGWLADPALALTDCALTTAGVAVVDGWWTLLAT